MVKAETSDSTEGDLERRKTSSRAVAGSSPERRYDFEHLPLLASCVSMLVLPLLMKLSRCVAAMLEQQAQGAADCSSAGPC